MKKEVSIKQKLAIRLQNLPAEQIKQAVLKWLDNEEADLDDLEQNLSLEPESSPHQPTLSPAAKAIVFREWANSHRRGLPLLSDETISRESIYSDEQL